VSKSAAKDNELAYYQQLSKGLKAYTDQEQAAMAAKAKTPQQVAEENARLRK
jgi:hypothetical protein